MFNFGFKRRNTSLPRAGLLLYLGRPNLEAADAPIGDDTEIGDDTIIRWMFLLPADADIRAATGWVSGVGNIFYDAAGDPVAVLASEIAAWSGINQWNILFHLVIADTETGRLAIYAVDTPVEILDRAMKVLRAPQPDLPSAFFNGMDFRLSTYTGGPTYELDHLGVLRSPGANRWAVRGMRLATTVADGAVLGPELVVNGSFDTSSEWSCGDGWSILDGVALHNVGTISSNIDQVNKLTVGKSYRVIFTIIENTSSYFKFNSRYDAINRTGITGTFTEYFVASTSVVSFRIESNGGVKFDNISIKEVIPTYYNTDESGNAILPSTPQKTVTYNTDWTAKTFAETFDKFDISDPLKAPGWLCEPPRTNSALPSAAPVTHTTGTLAVGTYTLWQEGTGSIVATAGTAVGTFGTASNGTPTTITITTAGTVVLTASGTNTWVQLELGAFKTSRIYTTTAPVTRAATIASFQTAGKIPVNNFAIRMIVVPRASGQFSYLFGSFITDASESISVTVAPSSVTARKRMGGVTTEASVAYTHLTGEPSEILFTSTAVGGMQISARTFSSSWGAFADGIPNSTTAAKANSRVGPMYQLGSLNSISLFTGNISLFDCVPIPSGITDPMAWAKTHWGVA